MARSAALSAAKQRFIDAQPNPERLSIDELRANDDRLFNSLMPDDAIVALVDAGGVPSLWMSVPGVDAESVIVHFHGGGYFIGSKEGRRALGAEFSRATRGRALVPGYRLAPENPFPAAVDDAVAVYRWLLEQVPASRVVLSGDSAGGGLALALVLFAKDHGLPQPAGLALLSPLVDMTAPGESWDTNRERDPIVPKPMLQFAIDTYLQGADPMNPLASPAYGDLAGLASMLILVGGDEAMLDDVRNFAGRASAAGVEVDLDVADDMFHIWPMFSSILPEGQEAVDRIGAFVRERTGT